MSRQVVLTMAVFFIFLKCMQIGED